METNELIMKTGTGRPNKDIEGETRARKVHGEQNKTGHKSDSYTQCKQTQYIYIF